jgi:hypothetical protein
MSGQLYMSLLSEKKTHHQVYFSEHWQAYMYATRYIARHKHISPFKIFMRTNGNKLYIYHMCFSLSIFLYMSCWIFLFAIPQLLLCNHNACIFYHLTFLIKTHFLKQLWENGIFSIWKYMQHIYTCIPKTEIAFVHNVLILIFFSKMRRRNWNLCKKYKFIGLKQCTCISKMFL